MPKISIAILAHNEQDQLPALFKSLGCQSMVTDAVASGWDLQVVCVPNGCADETERVASEALKHLCEDIGGLGHIRHAVCSLPEAGKVNAWNRFVHEFSDRDADYLLFMDADIDPGHRQTLQAMAECLEHRPEVLIATSLPIKDLKFKNRKSLVDHIALKASHVKGRSSRSSLCGQLYCGRADFFRQFEIPKGIICEDQFIAVMARSRLLRESEKPERIRLADNAAHVFQAYGRPTQKFNVMVRQELSHQIFLIVLNHLKKMISLNMATDAAEAMKTLAQQNPDWVMDHVRQEVGRRGLIVLEWGSPKKRFTGLKHFGWLERIRLLPSAFAAYCIDHLVCWSANRRMKRMQFAVSGRRL